MALEVGQAREARQEACPWRAPEMLWTALHLLPRTPACTGTQRCHMRSRT